MTFDRNNFIREIETLEIDLGKLIFDESQIEIFSAMAKTVSSYFNISQTKLTEIIMYAALMAQQSISVSISSINEALPQERLKLADFMVFEIVKFLKDYLINPEDHQKLIDISEKMLLQYLKDFGSR